METGMGSRQVALDADIGTGSPWWGWLAASQWRRRVAWEDRTETGMGSR